MIPITQLPESQRQAHINGYYQFSDPSPISNNTSGLAHLARISSSNHLPGGAGMMSVNSCLNTSINNGNLNLFVQKNNEISQNQSNFSQNLLPNSHQNHSLLFNNDLNLSVPNSQKNSKNISQNFPQANEYMNPINPISTPRDNTNTPTSATSLTSALCLRNS
jgi:hypothetical protein